MPKLLRDERDKYQESRAKNVTQLRGPFGSTTGTEENGRDLTGLATWKRPPANRVVLLTEASASGVIPLLNLAIRVVPLKGP